jgi:hypothetical protein
MKIPFLYKKIETNKSLRDTRRNKKYFDSFIALCTQYTKGFEHALTTEKENTVKIQELKRTNFRYTLEIFIAMYSRGDSFIHLNLFFKTVVEKFEDGFSDNNDESVDIHNFDTYIKTLWMLSWCVLLDSSKDIIERVVGVIEKTNKQDFFIELFASYLLHSKAAIPENTVLYHKIPYQKLMTIATNDLKTIAEKTKSFLEEDYYKDMEQAYWYDSDKNKNDLYFGYWCFEAAALMKVLSIDDAILKGTIYYPYDTKTRIDN